MAICSPPRSLSDALAWRTVDEHVALIEQELHARTADAFKLRGNEVIEALACGFGGNSDGAWLSHAIAFKFGVGPVGAAHWD